MQLTELRKELKFNAELLNLVETLKNIAGAQYHVMEKEKKRFDRFMEAFSGFFRVVNLVDVDDPLVHVVSDVLGLVVITSDSGFMGGLNQGVMRKAFEVQGDLPNDKVSLVILGDKGGSAIEDMRRKFKFFPGVGQTTIYEQALAVKNYVVNEVLERRMGKVVVVYPKPVSFTAQTIEVVNLLPCAELFDKNSESAVSGKVQEDGMVAEASKVVVESSFSDMVEYLAGSWVSAKLFEIFEDSKLAEYSARAMHLEGSHQKVSKDYKRVKQRCFKASHELIDKGMRESFAAKGGKKKRKKAMKEAA